MSGSRLTGRVVSKDGDWFFVEFGTGTTAARTWNLRPREMHGAVVGDTVVLEYQSTRTYGLWRIVEVNPETKEQERDRC